MTLAGFAIYAALINLVPLLIETGFSTQQAAVVLAVGGIGQVAGRIAYAPVLGPTSPDTKVIVVLLVTTVTTLGLAAAPEPATRAVRDLPGRRHGAGRVHPHPGHRRHRPLGDGVVRRPQQRAERRGPSRRGDRALARRGAAVALGGYQPAFVLLAMCALSAASLSKVGARRAGPGPDPRADLPSR